MARVKRGGPTLGGIAAETGVSVATVSRVLTGHSAISEETRERVLSTADRLGYVHVPQKTRRAVPSLSEQICLVVPVATAHGSQLANPFELALIGGIGTALRERRRDVSIVWQTPYDDATLAQFLDQSAYAGTIFLGQSQFHDTLNRYADLGKPLVAWGVEVAGQSYCSIGSDNHEGGFQATAHLLRKGRRRIAFIGATPPIAAARTPFSQIAIRLDGYRAALEAHDVAFDAAMVQTPTAGRFEGAEAVDNLLERGIAFDAIVAASDLVALGAIQTLRQRGLRVPEDVAVIGYDDIDAAALSTPGLTTIRQDVIKAGNLLVSKLLRIIDGHRAKSERLPTDLVIRESCGR
ncbi:LacI family DNA-binding transcriptional regulator [uncultured Sphingomonas sp.]|uniref:LacI family DNA-binding transcriptional regulator n=1 Tax=uncultured Sphingomonas sp. TaxID=158754 RepID=UPI0025D6CC9B|nr:LacI family DNA-binding transcriptional regulator [uncultured Sphingomonas sp.]